jgi:large subunit ribosomal protein L23
MGLTIYNVIQKLVVTDKTAKLARDLNKMTFRVHPEVNKPLIKQAVEKLFNVKVQDVKIIVRKGKVRTFKRIKSEGTLTKRAIVTLKKGYSFDMTAQGVPTETEKQG